MQLEGEIHADENVRRSTRLRKTSNYLKDYHHQISNSMKVKAKNTKVKYPINSVLHYDRMTHKQLCLINVVSSHIEPKSYEEASQYLYLLGCLHTNSSFDPTLISIKKRLNLSCN